MASEIQIQAECVKWLHNEKPQHRNCLIEINNSTAHGASRLAYGMVKSASDLIYISPAGEAVCIEVKMNGTRHDTKHIKGQIDFLRNVINRGGLGCFIFTLEQFKTLIDIIDNPNSYSEQSFCQQTIKNVREQYEKCKSQKTMTLYDLFTAD